MTKLEATVEIVKACLEVGGDGSTNSGFLHDKNREPLLKSIEAIYNKIDELEKNG